MNETRVVWNVLCVSIRCRSEEFRRMHFNTSLLFSVEGWMRIVYFVWTYSAELLSVCMARMCCTSVADASPIFVLRKQTALTHAHIHAHLANHPLCQRMRISLPRCMDEDKERKPFLRNECDICWHFHNKRRQLLTRHDEMKRNHFHSHAFETDSRRKYRAARTKEKKSKICCSLTERCRRKLQFIILRRRQFVGKTHVFVQLTMLVIVRHALVCDFTRSSGPIWWIHCNFVSKSNANVGQLTWTLLASAPNVISTSIRNECMGLKCEHTKDRMNSSDLREISFWDSFLLCCRRCYDPNAVLLLLGELGTSHEHRFVIIPAAASADWVQLFGAPLVSARAIYS